MSGLWNYGLVFVFGLLTGLAYIARKYQDAPLRALRTTPGTVYLLLNGVLSVLALAALDWSGVELVTRDPANPDAVLLDRVLVAGFGAMVLLRLKLSVPVSGEDGEAHVGPGQVFDSILLALDREVTKWRAQDKAVEVIGIMRGVSFDESQEALPMLCISLMRDGLSDEVKEQLGEDIRLLGESAISAEAKTALLGIALSNAVGESVLRGAVDALYKSPPPVTASGAGGPAPPAE